MMSIHWKCNLPIALLLLHFCSQYSPDSEDSERKKAVRAHRGTFENEQYN